MRRRVHFAAPFVLVVGCSGRAAPRTIPDDESLVAAAPADARPDAPEDAPPDASIDAPIDAFDAQAAFQATCNPCRDVGCHATCNPPPPRPGAPCGWPGSNCKPPAAGTPLDARVIGVRIEGAETIITVGRGKDRGVTSDWRARALQDDGKVIDTLPLEIIEVRATITHLRFRGTLEQGVRMVRLTPPP